MSIISVGPVGQRGHRLRHRRDLCAGDLHRAVRIRHGVVAARLRRRGAASPPSPSRHEAPASTSTPNSRIPSMPARSHSGPGARCSPRSPTPSSCPARSPASRRYVRPQERLRGRARGAVFANTGVTIDTVRDVLALASGGVIGAHFKVDGMTWNPVDADRMIALHGGREVGRARWSWTRIAAKGSAALGVDA